MDGKSVEEIFEFTTPNICVGNLVVGERYIEPTGKFWVKNLTTGDIAECHCIPRSGWIVKEKDKYNCEAVIKNKDGLETYKISGKLTEGFIATNIETGKTT